MVRPNTRQGGGLAKACANKLKQQQTLAWSYCNHIAFVKSIKIRFLGITEHGATHIPSRHLPSAQKTMCRELGGELDWVGVTTMDSL